MQSRYEALILDGSDLSGITETTETTTVTTAPDKMAKGCSPAAPVVIVYRDQFLPYYGYGYIPKTGVQFFEVSADVHPTSSIASREMNCGPPMSRDGQERFANDEKRSIVIWEERATPAVGDEQSLQHWVERGAAGSAALEAYHLAFRIDRVIGVLNIRFAEGHFSAEQVANLFQRFGQRIRDDLPNLP